MTRALRILAVLSAPLLSLAWSGVAVAAQQDDPRLSALKEQEWRSINTVCGSVDHRPALVRTPTFRADSVLGSSTLVLPARGTAYSLRQLVVRYPKLGVLGDDGSITLTSSLCAGPGATLRVSPADTSELRLRSDAHGHVALQAFLGSLDLRGSASRPLLVRSWDAAAAAPDANPSNGRAYVLEVGGTTVVDRVAFSELGYASGSVSGAAWKGVVLAGTNHPVRGTVTRSAFEHNHFGAYTYDAVGMRWLHDTFAGNAGYGFDPHDRSNGFLIADSVAHDNGSHGIIFSRGCDGNVVRNNESYDNAGHGIMIDDGHLDTSTANPRWQQAVPSNRNVIEDNQLWGNVDGVVVKGGIGNTVRANTISGVSRWAIRLTHGATKSVVQGNLIAESTRAAFLVEDGSADNVVSDNQVGHAPVGVEVRASQGNEFVGNRFDHLDVAAGEFSGNVAATAVRDNSFAGHGSQAFRTSGSHGFEAGSNDLSSWRGSAPGGIMSGGVLLWLGVLLVPAVARVVAKVRGTAL